MRLTRFSDEASKGMKVVQVVVVFVIVTVILIFLMRRTLSYYRMTRREVACNCLNIKPTISSSTVSQADSTAVEASTRADDPTAKSLKPSTFLLIMIPMRPDAFGKRKVIRGTWYKGYENNSSEVMLRFVIGTKIISEQILDQLREENSTYNDVVFTDLKETPRALTNKTLALMKWANDNVEFTYMMKCDDDTYVYVDNLITELKSRSTTTGLYYGKMVYDSPVMRTRNFKWSDPQWDLGDTYMPYALGGGYILSSDLVVMLAEQAEYLKWHPNEDTAVGSWLVPYEYERRSDDLVCVTDTNGTLKYRCVEHFPLFHIFYRFPQHFSGMTYFHKLYNEYVVAKKEVGT